MEPVAAWSHSRSLSEYDLEELAGAHKEVFEKAGCRPAQTTFGGTLVRDWIKVEIEATAVVGS